MKHFLIVISLLAASLAGCAKVDLNAPVPVFDTGVDSQAWATIPAGTFHFGQSADLTDIPYQFQIMVTDVTVSQYADFLNTALQQGLIKIEADQVKGPYPGDEFHGAKHEIRIPAGDYILVPTGDPASRFVYENGNFHPIKGWEQHPMTNVSWFGAWTYCRFVQGRLPSEMEWEKAARGAQDDRPFPWGDQIALNNANFYSSLDPFENMTSYGSRTTPVGFYNGKSYNGYVTLNSASPYGLYDMAGNVWQWVGDVLPRFSDRFMHGGSKATYDMDLRLWVRNSAPPMYYSPSVGFRCARNP